MAELFLDPAIRFWIFLPLVIITFLFGVIRHYMTILFASEKKSELENIGDMVSSASWYFLNIFGLRSVYGLVLGSDNAADQPMMLMPDHAPPAAQPPQDIQKAFKAEWEALELVEHKWALADSEMRLLSRCCK